MAHLLAQLDRRGLGTEVPEDLGSWHVGALGEVVVGHELARLPAEWAVLHAIPVGAQADIDHLVIGPPGVFVINTKRHVAKQVRVGTHAVWINGAQENGYQRHLQNRAKKVVALLSGEDGLVPVHPMLVFVDVARLSSIGEPTVEFVASSGLVEDLLGREPVLAPEQVQALLGKASRPVTWGRSASVLHEPDPTPRFLDLTLEARPPVPVPMSRPHPVRAGRARPAATRPDHARARAHASLLAAVAWAFGTITALALAPLMALTGFGVAIALAHALLAH